MERLNKFLAHAGVASRRQCDELIAAGRVKVDGRVIRDLGVKIDPAQHKVAVDDAPVRTEKPTYWVVNKPVGYLCTNNDPAGRPLAIDLVPKSEQRVYTVGRLDEASEGLLLMTNDGELAHQLMHPKFQIEKTYLVLVAGMPNREDEQKLLDGVWLSDGKVRARRVRKMKTAGESTWLRIVLCEGKNREIRRMLAKLGHKVMKLRRIAIGPVELDRLPKGKARRLSLKELQGLQKAVEDSKKQLDQVRERATTKPPATQPQTAARPPVPPRPATAARPPGPPRPPTAARRPAPRRPRV